MRIAVNTRLLLKGRLEGIGWYTFETLKRITAAHTEHDFFFLFDRAYDASFIFSPNVYPIVLRPPTRHPFLWYYWFEFAVPKALKDIEADVFLSPDGYCSLKTDVPTVMVIHDLAFEHYPLHVPAVSRWYYLRYTRLYARRADMIVTVSNFSKKDISYRYGIAPSKIDVTYNGVNESFGVALPQAIDTAKTTYASGHDYFIYIGNINPRKNLIGIFKAFDQFKQATGADTKLVITGAKGWQYQQSMQVYQRMQYKDDVVLTGHLAATQLSALLAGSIALLYVSFFEGFGIPVVEAMRAGVPVITSNVSSMPEVAGDAALLVDPHEPSQISSAMKSLFNDQALRRDLIAKGHRQAAQFTWDKTAEGLWDALMKVALGNGQ